jgi:serine/threonine protein phosphatase PrpC
MVLGRQKKKGWRSTWEAIDLSIDHKPTAPEERNRILDNHGRVERCGLRTGFAAEARCA